jgi:voltage-gated potassium channel
MHRLGIVLLLIVSIILVGTIGYSAIEGYALLDAAFFTVITLSTVGYGYIETLSPPGKIFTAFLILFGLGTLAYGLHSMTEFIIEGQLHTYFRRSKMEKRIRKIENHYIVCGLGQTGRSIVEELQHGHYDFVVVDKNEEALKGLPDTRNLLFYQGDATEDTTLEACGVERAQGLLAALDSDVDNLFIVLSAREKNPNIRVVARATNDAAVSKMIRAGADNVIAPNQLGGLRMASLMLRPHVVSFLDVTARSRGGNLRLEEVTIGANSRVCGMTLQDAALPQKTGLIVIAIRNQETGEFVYNPRSDTKLECGDVIIVLGDADQMERLSGVVREPA